jgi:hypothetical protein
VERFAFVFQEYRQHRHIAQRGDVARHRHLPGNRCDFHGEFQVCPAESTHDLALHFHVLRLGEDVCSLGHIHDAGRCHNIADPGQPFGDGDLVHSASDIARPRDQHTPADGANLARRLEFFHAPRCPGHTSHAFNKGDTLDCFRCLLQLTLADRHPPALRCHLVAPSGDYLYALLSTWLPLYPIVVVQPYWATYSSSF